MWVVSLPRGGPSWPLRRPSSLLVGIDWATQTHEVCVLDGSRNVVAKRPVANTADGLEELIRWLLRYSGGDPQALAVAIERPDGPLVETLLDYEIAVYTLNPKQLDRFRDRHGVAGAKDDRRDAFVLADALGTDRHHFRRVVPLEPELLALRGLVRCDDELRVSENRLGNRFQEQPAPLFPPAAGPGRGPSRSLPLGPLGSRPHAERKPRGSVPRRSSDFCGGVTSAGSPRGRSWRSCDRPAVRVSPATTEDAVERISLLLPQLRLTHSQRVTCGRRMDQRLKALVAAPPPQEKRQHSDAAILDSLPGVGRAVIARVLTEGADAIRQRDLKRLRAPWVGVPR